MAIMYSGITRPAPAPGGFKLLVRSHQARQVTSLGTLPQVGLSLPLSSLIQLWPLGGPVRRALLGCGDCVSLAGPGVLPSFLRLPSPKEQVGGTSVPLPDPGMSCLPGTLSGQAPWQRLQCVVCSLFLSSYRYENCSDRDVEGVEVGKGLVTGHLAIPSTHGIMTWRLTIFKLTPAPAKPKT